MLIDRSHTIGSVVGVGFVLLTLFSTTVAADSSGNGMELLPESNQYSPYLANPVQTRFKLSRITVSDVEIPNTGDARWELKAGRTIGLLRFNRHWQLNIFGGFMATFDVEESTDSIAWDGLFGAKVVRSINDYSALKIGAAHQSAHRGDEFIERTGRNRIDYTRQEWNLGYSHWFSDITRTYVEFGWATTLRNSDLQEAGRLQAGFEYGVPSSPGASSSDRFRTGWFTAADFESMEERDWQLDSSLSAGYFLLRESRLWRIGLDVRDGRSPYGEFFRSDETYWGLSVWNDFL